MYKCVNVRSPKWGILNSIIYIINIYIIIMNEKDITLSFIHYFALTSMKENYYERRIQRRNQK